MRGLTRTAAIELGRDGIRVDSIDPGVVNTPLITSPLRLGAAPVSDYCSPEPFAIERPADPQDITNLLLLLASDDASSVTGSEHIADGGLLLGPALAAGQTQNRASCWRPPGTSWERTPANAGEHRTRQDRPLSWFSQMRGRLLWSP